MSTNTATYTSVVDWKLCGCHGGYVATQLNTAYSALLLDLKNAVHKLLQVKYASQFYCEMWKIICAIYTYNICKRATGL